jgi:hypothetical protein
MHSLVCANSNFTGTTFASPPLKSPNVQIARPAFNMQYASRAIVDRGGKRSTTPPFLEAA